MKRKFACIEYIESLEEIPIKFKVINKAPTKILDWYINKFNPYRIENLEILGEEGYLVKLPILKEEATEKLEKMSTVTLHAMSSLRDYNVDIITVPKTCSIEGTAQYIATGKKLVPFFIMPAINKALKIMKKELKDIEVLILGDSELTTALMYSIYPEVNFLSIMVDDDIEKYEAFVSDIFYDTGLNLQVMKTNKAILSSADIVINTCNSEKKFDFNFKRGVIYFDFSTDEKKRIELISKREDMLTIDGFLIKQGENTMTLPNLELGMYVKSREYRGIFLRGYDNRMAADIKSQFKNMDIRLSSFTQLHTVLNSRHFSKFLQRAGLQK